MWKKKKKIKRWKQPHITAQEGVNNKRDIILRGHHRLEVCNGLQHLATVRGGKVSRIRREHCELGYGRVESYPAYLSLRSHWLAWLAFLSLQVRTVHLSFPWVPLLPPYCSRSCCTVHTQQQPVKRAFYFCYYVTSYRFVFLFLLISLPLIFTWFPMRMEVVNFLHYQVDVLW